MFDLTKRKIVSSSLLSLFLLLSFVITASAVSTEPENLEVLAGSEALETLAAVSGRFDCSYAGISCKGVNVTSYGTAMTTSDSVYAIKGQVLAVNNTSSGPFNLVTQLVDSNHRAISDEIAFTDTVFVTVPYSGNYLVKVTCKDASLSKRCLGQGSVSQ